LLLHIIAENLACGLILWSYVRIDYNIKQK